MLDFLNTTERESFKNTINVLGLKIKPIPIAHKTQRIWNIEDHFGNEWYVVFPENGDEFYIYNIFCFHCYEPFRIDFTMNDNIVKIHRMVKDGRNIVCELSLMKFRRKCLIVNCLYMFGYMK